MSQQAKIIWIVVIIVVIVIGLLWWYLAQPSNTTVSTTTGTPPTITSFDFAGLTPAVSGTVDNTNYAVSLDVPNGTDVTNLTPTITLSDNTATVFPASGVAQDFTNPVTYTVTGQDGSTQNYTVTVTVTVAAQ